MSSNNRDYNSDMANSNARQRSTNDNRNSDTFVLGNREYTLESLLNELIYMIRKKLRIENAVYSKDSLWAIFLKFLGLIFFIYIFFTIFISITATVTILMSKSNLPPVKPPAPKVGINELRDPEKVSLGCSKAELFKHSKVYGKDELFVKCIKSIIKHQSWISSLRHDHLEKIIDPSNMAYLLTGPPGTGKTLFVKSLAYKVDILLRKKYLKSTKGLDFVNDLKKSGKYDSFIDSMESRVEYYYVTPSSIINKYVGESEKNVQTLFRCARNFTEDCRASFIFFDEAESFFGARSNNHNSDGDITRSNIKSELLSNISATPSRFKSVFIFAATNLPESFDTAFKRRFGTEVPFKVPDEKERKILVKELLKGVNVPSGEIDKIVKLTAGKAQSYINKRIRSYLEFDNSGACTSLNFKGLKNHLEREANNPDIY